MHDIANALGDALGDAEAYLAEYGDHSPEAPTVPTFADMPAEEKALDLVAEHDDLEETLWFLLHWPEPHWAARLVLAAPQPLNGDRYFLLAPLAALLGKCQPLAAAVCLLSMIDFALKVARSKRYIHAARHLETCHRLAAAIND